MTSPSPTETAVAPTAANRISTDKHPVDQVPTFLRGLILGLQHVLAMYAGAVAVPLVVGGALIAAGKLEPNAMPHLIAADLFVAGIASIVQSVGIWKFGSRLPLMQGVSFVSVAPMITIGSEYGITAIYGSVIVTGIAMMAFAPLFAKVLKFFPPLVTGTVITSIGLTLVGVSAGWILDSSAPEGEQGAPVNFLMAGFTLLVVIAVNTFAPKMVKPTAVLIGIIAGTVLAALLGHTDWTEMKESDWVAVPTPFQFGVPTFEIAGIITMLIVGLVIMTETSSDILAVGEIVDRRVDAKTLANGLRADGLGTMLGGIFNTFPYTALAQNVGLVNLSKVRSRYVITFAGAILIVLGFIPKFGGVVAAIPSPVLGGAGIALFGMVAVAGIRTLAEIDMNETQALIVAVALSVALMPSIVPNIYDALPEQVAMLLHSGVASGALVAIVLNLIFNRKNGAHKADLLVSGDINGKDRHLPEEDERLVPDPV